VAIETSLTLTAGRDRAGDHPLSDLVTSNSGAKSGDDSHWLVSDDATRSNWILTLQNVDVGSADRRGSDAKERVSRTDGGEWSFLKLDLSRLDEDCGFHRDGQAG